MSKHNAYVIIFLFFPLSYARFITPILTCDSEDRRTLPDISRSCRLGCVPGDEGKKIRIDLFNLNQEYQDVSIASCKRRQFTLMNTQTWTFSKISSLVDTKDVDLVDSECRNAWKSQCDERDCDITPEVPKSQTFFWASDYVEISEGLILRTRRVISYRTLSGTVIVFNSAHYLVKDDDPDVEIEGVKWILPDSIKTSSEECPWRHGETLLCTTELNGIWCDKEEIFLSLPKGFDRSLCPDREIFLSVSGHVWSHHRKDDSNMILDPGDREIFDYSPDQIQSDSIGEVNHLLHSRDIARCIDGCSMISSVNWVTGKIVRINSRPYKSDGKNLMYVCRKIPPCEVAENASMCQSPRLIRVRCGTMQAWWDEESEDIVNFDCPDQYLVSLNRQSEISHINRLWGEEIKGNIEYGLARSPNDDSQFSDPSTSRIKKKIVTGSSRKSSSIFTNEIHVGILDSVSQIIKNLSYTIPMIILGIGLFSVSLIVMVNYWKRESPEKGVGEEEIHREESPTSHVAEEILPLVHYF